MGSNKRRQLDDHRLDANKKHQQSPSSSSATTPNTQSSSNPSTKRPTFPSYLDIPNLPPKIKLLCEIIANTPSSSVEAVLATPASMSPSPTSSKSSSFLTHSLAPPSSSSAGPSMRREGLVSLATFASVFDSYVIAGRVKEAIMTFEVMDQYGCPRDVVALNSLLSAICRDGKNVDAVEFLHVASNVIKPDADTYAILLEGWEKEMNVLSARQTFMEMIRDIGWDPVNVPAYDTFLCTLLMDRDGLDEAIGFLQTMKDRSVVQE
ncbi:hypothetical protein GH714_032765 [Hevea brasiliensis]|uniref:Pentacotripeptide-repeat region of PRORP domain-containing protein n=1 Tax=Hevea brasiliensis TaxID=3981 RepID=A0A6A6L1Y2_HEVBR|nr:hypothetical protein GH714_032765 [Hevea brasiliensis]